MWTGDDMMLPSNQRQNEYKDILQGVTKEIQTSQFRAVSAINHELVMLYWKIGKVILNNQNREGWGSKFIDNLAVDIKVQFPQITGFSVRNLKYMRKFAREYPDFEFVQVPLAQIQTINKP